MGKVGGSLPLRMVRMEDPFEFARRHSGSMDPNDYEIAADPSLAEVMS